MAINIPLPRASCTGWDTHAPEVGKNHRGVSPLFRTGRGDFVQQDVNGRQRQHKPAVTAKSGMQEGVVEQNRNTSSVAMVAPIGICRRRAFARRRISGCTFSCSQANILPVRYAGLYFIQNHQRAEFVTEAYVPLSEERYPCGGRITPPSP